MLEPPHDEAGIISKIRIATIQVPNLNWEAPYEIAEPPESLWP
jgi:hypothetical protein